MAWPYHFTGIIPGIGLNFHLSLNYQCNFPVFLWSPSPPHSRVMKKLSPRTRMQWRAGDHQPTDDNWNSKLSRRRRRRTRTDPHSIAVVKWQGCDFFGSWWYEYRCSGWLYFFFLFFLNGLLVFCCCRKDFIKDPLSSIIYWGTPLSISSSFWSPSLHHHLMSLL